MEPLGHLGALRWRGDGPSGALGYLLEAQNIEKTLEKQCFSKNLQKKYGFELNARTSSKRACHAGKTAILRIFGSRQIRPNQFSKQRKLSSRVGESSIYNIFEKMK